MRQRFLKEILICLMTDGFSWEKRSGFFLSSLYRFLPRTSASSTPSVIAVRHRRHILPDMPSLYEMIFCFTGADALHQFLVFPSPLTMAALILIPAISTSASLIPSIPRTVLNRSGSGFCRSIHSKPFSVQPP